MPVPYAIVDGLTNDNAEVIGRKLQVGGSLTVSSITGGNITAVPSLGSLTSKSGALAAGGVSETLAVINTSRHYLLIENPSTATGQNIATAEALFVRFGNSSAGVNNGTSFEILPGGSLSQEGSFVSTEAVQVNATTTGHKWIAVEG